MPNIFSALHLYPINGVASRIENDGTAWSYRDAKWAATIFAADPEPANVDDQKAWVVDYWDAVHPHSAGGAYVNFMGDEGQDRIKTAYRDNYPRLAEIKKRYDPDNLFRLNQNIKPAE